MKRAVELVESYRAAVPDRPVPAAAGVLSVLLAAQARERGCGPHEVPLRATGYLLVDERRAHAYLDMMAAGAEGSVWRDWPIGPTWWQSGPYREAAQVVYAAWLVEVGRVRIGDRVLVLEESAGLEAPWRGRVVAAEWHLIVQDQPDTAGELLLPSEPFMLYVLPADEQLCHTAADPRNIHPSNVLLDPDHHDHDTRDAGRAHAMMIHAVVSDLRFIEMLINGGWYHEVQVWLARLQRLYAAAPVDAGARSALEELAGHPTDAALAMIVRRCYLQFR